MSTRSPHHPRDYRLVKEHRAAADERLARAVPRGHAFTFYRVGEDMCVVCRKTKKEHHGR